MADSHENSGYFRLEANEILSTTSILQRRVLERFPESGLSAVAGEIEQVAKVTQGRIEDMSRPFWPLRLLSLSLLGLTLLSLACGVVLGVDWGGIGTQVSFSEFIEVLEPTLGSSVFIGAFWIFSWSLENRWKQKRVLRAINELRSLIHVVDMHQLTKDPERANRRGPDTASSPKRPMTLFELGRYLEYCSELLSVISKVAALYPQAFPEPAILSATDQVETLATGLSRKIWQKLMLLEKNSD